jgi:flavin reductase (DIM6/NTAB) family NADH-FMN oxidoreductase RutF
MHAIVEQGRFAVNMLGAQCRHISQLFASSGIDGKFDQVAWYPGRLTGMPLLRRRSPMPDAS